MAGLVCPKEPTLPGAEQPLCTKDNATDVAFDGWKLGMGGVVTGLSLLGLGALAGRGRKKEEPKS